MHPSKTDYQARLATAQNRFHLLQEPAEIIQLYQLIEEAAPTHVLEIGAHHGGWAFLIAGACAPGAKIVSVDFHARPEQVQSRQLIKTLLAKEGREYRCIVGDSTNPETVEAVRGELPEVNLLHIDGNHDYSTCRRDWDNYRSLLQPGGILVLHDTRGQVGVEKLWGELAGIEHGQRREFLLPKRTPLMGTGVITF